MNGVCSFHSIAAIEPLSAPTLPVAKEAIKERLGHQWDTWRLLDLLANYQRNESIAGSCPARSTVPNSCYSQAAVAGISPAKPMCGSISHLQWIGLASRASPGS